MRAEKDSFLVFYEWENNLENLTDEQAGVLFRAMFAYEKRGEAYAGADPAVAMAMSFIRCAIDRNRQKYLERCKANRQNGKRGGRPSKSQGKPAETQENQSVSTETQKTERLFQKPKKPEHEREHEREREHEPEREHDRDREREREPEREPEREQDADAAGSGLFPFAREDVDCFVDTLTQAGIAVDNDGRRQLEGWLQRYDFGFVDAAVGEAVRRNARKLSYLAGIIRNWDAAGITTGDRAAEYLVKTGVWRAQ